MTYFAAEFTNQAPLYSPAETPLNANTLFRVRFLPCSHPQGYSYVSPSVIFANNNVIGEECMASDIKEQLKNSPFFRTYELDTTSQGFLGRGSFSVVRSVNSHVTISLIQESANAFRMGRNSR